MTNIFKKIIRKKKPKSDQKKPAAAKSKKEPLVKAKLGKKKILPTKTKKTAESGPVNLVEAKTKKKAPVLGKSKSETHTTATKTNKASVAVVGRLPVTRTAAKYKLCIDPVFLHKVLQKDCDEHVQPASSVFLEGVLQYVAAELLESSYRKARERMKTDACQITAEDIKTAIETDEELGYFIGFKKKEQKVPAKKSELQPENPSIPTDEEIIEDGKN